MRRIRDDESGFMGLLFMVIFLVVVMAVFGCVHTAPPTCTESQAAYRAALDADGFGPGAGAVVPGTAGEYAYAAEKGRHLRGRVYSTEEQSEGGGVEYVGDCTMPRGTVYRIYEADVPADEAGAQ